MELQKVNVKDFDLSTLKEGEILDIPRYQELSLVLKTLESETIKDNINSEFIQGLKSLIEEWSISTPDYSRPLEGEVVEERKTSTLGIYYSKDKNFRVMFDPKNIDRIHLVKGNTGDLLPRIGFDFFVEYLDSLDLSSEDSFIKSLKKRVEYRQSLSKNKLKNSSKKSKAKDIVESYHYLEQFGNTSYHKEAEKMIVDLFKSAKKENFDLHRNETIIFYGNLHDLLSKDVKDKVKKLVYDLWKSEQGSLFELFKKIFVSNKILDKEELHKYLKEVFLKDCVSNLKKWPISSSSTLDKIEFSEVLMIVDEFSSYYHLKEEDLKNVDEFKFRFLNEYSILKLKEFYNDFEEEKDCKQLFVDLFEQSLRFSEGKLAIKFQSLSLLSNYLLLDMISDKGYKYSLIGTSARSEEDYRMTMDELNRLSNNLKNYSSNVKAAQTILVPEGSKDYLKGVAKLKGSDDTFIELIEKSLDEVKSDCLNNIKENYLLIK